MRWASIVLCTMSCFTYGTGVFYSGIIANEELGFDHVALITADLRVEELKRKIKADLEH